ncbi:S-fimbrial adhesin protein SfaG [Escherichia coli]|uniref:S-fimbrial adhesin protein SfaG n=1 Tax=Escherichia coli TaxID=562 RepID=A0A377K1B4_ECOLX|nr:S-fimbrial adhesin protein SfaG [Escherichia coli]
MVKDIIKTVTFSCMLAGSMFVTCHVCAAGFCGEYYRQCSG